jgi:hypothetical protein
MISMSISSAKMGHAWQLLLLILFMIVSGCNGPNWDRSAPDATLAPQLREAFAMSLLAPESDAQNPLVRKDLRWPLMSYYNHIPWGIALPVDGETRAMTWGFQPIELSVSKAAAREIEEAIFRITHFMLETWEARNEQSRLKYGESQFSAQTQDIRGNWRQFCSFRVPTLTPDVPGGILKKDQRSPLLEDPRVMLPLIRIQLHIRRGWLRANPITVGAAQLQPFQPRVFSFIQSLVPPPFADSPAVPETMVTSRIEELDFNIALLDRELARLGIDPPAMPE